MADSEGKTEDAVEAVPAEQEATSEEPSSQGDDVAPTAEITSQLMSNPMVLAALQQKLGSMVGGSSGYIQSLPKVVKRRIKALKKIQFEATKIEAEFYREVHRLECEYAAKYSPLFEKRSTMVTGAYEPDDGEADWPSDDEKEDLAVSSSNEEVKNKANIEEKTEENDEKTEEKDENVKGIPGFWLTIFKNVDMLSEMIQAHDEPILNTLQDVKVEFKEKDPMGFALEFYFEANDFFENKKLTKEYTMRSEPDEADPFSFEGPEIVKCQGCKIDWKKGKNVTVKTVKKKQKHKASGTTRTISKTVQSDSFFNFFSPPSPPDDEEMDEDTEALLAADFEIGHFIRERIVPRAVLYFTGEALENDDEFEEGEEEEGAEEGEYDEDGDPDFNPGGVKFVSPTFHAHVAQLALGRVSKPSSAPPDTRLLLRPSTAASTHKPSAPRPDLPSRPGTAPIGSEGFHTPEDKEPPPKPNTNAFQETKSEAVVEHKPESVSGLARSTLQGGSASSKSERPKSVSFGSRTVAVDHTGQPVGGEGGPARTRKTEALTNALEPEIADKDLRPDRKRLTRETTFYEKTGGLSREKTFITSRSGKGGERVRNPELQPLVEVITAESDPSSEPDTQTDTPADTNVTLGGRKKMQEADMVTDKRNNNEKTETGAAGQGKVPEVDHDRNRKVITEAGGRQKIPVGKLAITKGDSACTAVDQQSEKSQETQAGIKKHSSKHNEMKKEAPEEEKPSRDKRGKGGIGKTAKDEARNILQRLTGKAGHQQRQGQQRPHRAGQVPTVGRPTRRYVFDKPSEKPAPEAVGVDGKPASAPPGHGRGQAPGDRKGGLKQPASSVTRSQSLNRPDRRGHAGNASAGEADNRSLGIKPASAPAHRVNQRARSHERIGAKPQADSQARAASKPQAGEQEKEEYRSGYRHGSRQPVIAEHRTEENPENSGEHRKRREVTSSGYNAQMELRKSGHFKQKVDTKQHEHSEQKEPQQEHRQKEQQSDQADTRERRRAGPREITGGGPGRGVRMQNAMIDSSLEVSGAPEPGGELDEEGWEDEDLPGGLHPKLRDSPYLKDNRLLMAKSGKSRPGATLSAASKRGGGNAS